MRSEQSGRGSCQSDFITERDRLKGTDELGEVVLDVGSVLTLVKPEEGEEKSKEEAGQRRLVWSLARAHDECGSEGRKRRGTHS